MTQRQEMKGTWIYRAVVGAMLTTVLTFVMKTYYEFQDMKVTVGKHDISLSVLDKQTFQNGVDVKVQTARIDKIYESRIFQQQP